MSSSWSVALSPRGYRIRVRVLSLALLTAWLLVASTTSSQTARVPPAVQAALLSKVASFDRNFQARAGKRALVLVVQMPGDAESKHDAASMDAALSQLPTVGNLPHDEVVVNYTGAAALAEQIRSRRAAIVYFGSGFSDQVPAIRNALSSVSVLSFGSVPDYIPVGVVLGVDLVSGRPKLLVNLTQAKQQSVSLPASVLNLMKVYK